MKLLDASVGAVLVDKEGDVWVRLDDSARCVGCGYWRERELAQADKTYGPFEMMVPATIVRELRHALTAAIGALAGPRDPARDLEVIGQAQAALAAADHLEP